MRNPLLRLLTAATLAICATSLHAQGAATRIVVPFAPGGAQDVIGRCAPFAARALGKATIEINVGPQEKIAALRMATGLGDVVADIDVAPPTLDEIYVGFLRRRSIAP